MELQGTKAGLQMQEAMSGVKSSPQLALLLTYPAPVPGAGPLLPFDAAAVVNSPYIQWISVESAKPVGTGCTAYRAYLSQCPCISADDAHQQQLRTNTAATIAQHVCSCFTARTIDGMLCRLGAHAWAPACP